MTNEILRSVRRKRKYSPDVFFGDSRNGFAVFCGDRAKRSSVFADAVMRNFGKRGVVVIHSDNEWNDEINSRIIGFNRLSGKRLNAYYIGSSYTGGKVSEYDPLYGLNANYASKAIIYANKGTNKALASDINDYLDVLFESFTMNNNGFGEAPYNLPMLIGITNLNSALLRTTVLSRLNTGQNGARDARNERLNRDDVHTNVHEAVVTFSQSISDLYYVPEELNVRGQGCSHSCISVASVMKEKGIINIHLPNNNEDVLNYIAHELEYLNTQYCEYCIAIHNVSIADSEKMKKIVYGPQTNYSVGLSEPTIKYVVESFCINKDGSNNFPLIPKIAILQCPRDDIALPFAMMTGEYDRHFNERTETRERGRLFHSLHDSIGTSDRIGKQYNVTTADFIKLGYSGAVLLDADNPQVITEVKNFT